ncbi:kinase-like domain-containing protein [Gigaspora rosea]|uniref:Kinase-like domain-containing protein n=1 Tax=Gigaspora rosea TaxID=44941 RepID=A0A397VE25_9GLOM|nr:kinase-like domain-containing protein [Gigaspora rosea]
MATNPIAEDVKTGATTAIQITAEIAASYIPLVAAVKTLFEEIHKIYENAECNKEMCTIMTERIEAAKYALQKMMRKDDSYIYEKEYSLSLKKFVKVLTEIKDFTDKVSKLEGVRKFIEAGKIKQQFYKLIQDYDICMKELQFAMAITNENEREEEAKRIEKALKDLENLEYGVEIANNKLDGLAEDISFIKNKMSDAQAQKIKLSEPLTGCVKRNSVIKMFYMGTAVACKPIDDSEKHQATLAILEKLSLSPCILKFYGLSEFDNHTYMVFDWAEYGNLKELYDSFDIPWTRKIRFIRDICRGLVFLRELDILHHDIRCENIFICEGLSPKLGNFIHARKVNANTSFLSFQKQIEMFRWMAPEQIEKYQNNPKQKGYTFSCEMFSFGMLIWELCYEKIPYKRYSDPKKISKHVVIGKREKLLLGKSENPNDIKIQEQFIKIIDKGKLNLFV